MPRSGRVICGYERTSSTAHLCLSVTFPRDLRDDLAGADTVILKGDLNYRRLVGDYHWSATESFSALTEYFPTRVIALRTLKCDVAVGIDAGMVADLERTEPDWRISGSHGVVQMSTDTNG